MARSGKALCIGVDYAGTEAELRGPVNDALHWLDILTRRCGLSRGSVLVLIDEYPSGEAVRDGGTGEYRRPTQENILGALAWLVLDAAPGDSLFFSFSGHGVQLAGGGGRGRGPAGGPSGEETEEALCPADWAEFEWGVVPHRLVGLDVLQRHFARLPGGALLTLVLDADLVGTPLQLPLRVDGRLPLREAEGEDGGAAPRGSGRWPPRDPAAWLEGRHVNALPRRLPFELRRPLWSGLAGSLLRETTPPLDEGLAVFCFAACRGSQSALEASLEGLSQGCLSYCLLRALELLNFRCTYMELCEAANGLAQQLRAEVMPCMDQFLQLCYGKNAAPDECRAFDPGSALAAKDRARRRRGQWRRASQR
mmetsp:Transcript_34257/g.107542  ORF Transcript_34257/g.107542 Transcript_34257/m.107542 type:complete len:366 (+) Transcript_34257:155-1252(+)